MGFNLGNWINQNIPIKDIGSKIGDIGNKFLSFSENMLNNVTKLTSNFSNLLGSSFMPYVLVIGGAMFLYYRTGGGLIK